LGWSGSAGARKKDPQALAQSKPSTACKTTGPNEVWVYDFVFDAYANGQKLKCLTLIDEFTKESLRIDVTGSIKGKRVDRF